jgi:hypothetical protein
VVEKCLECDRYQLEIQNLQQGLRLAKDEARVAQIERPKEEMRDQFTLMLSLAYRLDEARRRYTRHRTAHAILN